MRFRIFKAFWARIHRFFMIQGKYEHAKNLLKWIERFFFLLGTWPLRSTKAEFYICLTCLAIHLFFLQVYLYYVFGDLQAMVMKVTDTGLLLMVSCRLIIVKFSLKLRKILELTINFIHNKHFRNGNYIFTIIGLPKVILNTSFQLHSSL